MQLNKVNNLDLIKVIAGHAVSHIKNDMQNFRMLFGVFNHLIEREPLFPPSRFRNLPSLYNLKSFALGILAKTGGLLPLIQSFYTENIF